MSITDKMPETICTCAAIRQAARRVTRLYVMDRATLGHNLRPLEAEGLVTMSVGTDRRSRLVSLTPAGRQKLAEAKPLWRAAQKAFETKFGADEAAALRATMSRVAHLDFPSLTRP